MAESRVTLISLQYDDIRAPYTSLVHATAFLFVLRENESMNHYWNFAILQVRNVRQRSTVAKKS